MNIVYSCDDLFAPICATSITSLLENNKAAERVQVFVLGNKLSKKSREKLGGMADSYTGGSSLGINRSIKVIGMENFEESLRKLTDVDEKKERFPLTAFLRIFASKFLPEDVERFLYLDSDTIVRDDIRGLFGAKLMGRVAGMIPEPTIYKEVKKYLGLREEEPYYNSGVMLVDRSLWEKEDISGKCVKLLRKKHGSYKFADQDLLNVVLKGRVRALSAGYDFFSNYHFRSYKSLVNLAPWYALSVTEAAYNAARNNPAIVHFAGAECPWYEGNHNPYRAEYEKYLSLSPYVGTAKTKGHEREMFFYHLLNLMTRAAPRLRDWISTRYYKGWIK